MQPDTPKMAGTSPAKAGGKVRLKTLDDLDRRTRAASAMFALRDKLIADLGGEGALSVMQLELVDNASCLGAILRDSATSYLQGEPIDLSEYMSLTNAQRRLLADLGLERKARDITPSLKEYADQHYAGAAS